ncbi:MAG: ABC transporter permease [Candidatus Marinimicrobia bacterium]|nr:ABC transporter permease [Candidatus Neomarinimicrobiota bacterium]
MKWVNIKRVLKNGFVHFWRNGWVSVATILIMVITLFSIGSLVFGKAILLSVLDQLQDKVDITVYFKTDAGESDIIFLRESLTDLSEVDEVTYISKEEALKTFQDRHSENTLITQSLEELGDNPLGGSLNVRAKDPSQYEGITKFLEAGVFSAIDKINYRQNKVIIDRLSAILQTSKSLGAGVSILLALIALLVTFNTIRLAIYTNREEIKIMRLVGASDKYVRSPFVVGGFLYGFISTVITMIFFYPLTFWLGPLSERFFGGVNVFHYYLSNFFQLFFILLVVGVLLGICSSWVATRRYLKI